MKGQLPLVVSPELLQGRLKHVPAKFNVFSGLSNY